MPLATKVDQTAADGKKKQAAAPHAYSRERNQTAAGQKKYQAAADGQKKWAAAPHAYSYGVLKGGPRPWRRRPSDRGQTRRRDAAPSTFPCRDSGWSPAMKERPGDRGRQEKMPPRPRAFPLEDLRGRRP